MVLPYNQSVAVHKKTFYMILSNGAYKPGFRAKLVASNHLIQN